MINSRTLAAAATLAVFAATALPANAQSNFTFDPVKSVLIDNATGRQWVCGFAWQYSQEHITGSTTYLWGKDVYPGLFSSTPYGDGGGWRMPTTAEFQDALRKGFFQEFNNVSEWCKTQPLPPGSSYYPGKFASNHRAWVVDPRANNQWAYAYVISSGERIKAMPTSGYFTILCR